MAQRVYKKKCRHCGSLLEYFHGEKEEICPKCGMGDYIKPETETELFLLQKKYFETRENKYLGNIYSILVKYGMSKIKKILKGNIIYSTDKIEECAHNSATKLIEYFLKNPDYKIDTSFMGVLTKQIQSVLYDKKVRKIEDIDSLNEHFERSEKEKIDFTEFQSVFNPIHEEFNEEQHYGDNLVKEIISLLKSSLIQISKNYDLLTSMRVQMGLIHSIKQRKNEKLLNRFYQEKK